MEPIVPHKKLESGVFQGTPELSDTQKVAPARLFRTMKLDMAEAVKNQNETVVSIAIAEEKKKAVARAEASSASTEQKTEPLPAPKPIGRFVIVLIVLLVAVALVLSYLFVLPRLGGIKLPSISIPVPSFGTPPVEIATSTEPIVSLAPSLIPAQSEKKFSVTEQTSDQIFSEIQSERNQGLSAGSIKNLYFTAGSGAEALSISANRLFISLDISAPELLTRSLEKPFMVGLWGEETWGATPFLILKVSGYETGLAGMLEWEANLPRSFDSIFGTTVARNLNANTKFRDIVILGKDARVLETPLGGTIAYVFANQSTIVIAGTISALEALVPIAGRE